MSDRIEDRNPFKALTDQIEQLEAQLAAVTQERDRYKTAAEVFDVIMPAVYAERDALQAKLTRLLGIAAAVSRRCLVTGHSYGTDTVGIRPCQCDHCQLARAIAESEEQR